MLKKTFILWDGQLYFTLADSFRAVLKTIADRPSFSFNQVLAWVSFCPCTQDLINKYYCLNVVTSEALVVMSHIGEVFVPQKKKQK